MGNRLIQEDLKPLILGILVEHGGVAPRSIVVSEIYSQLDIEFNTDYFLETDDWNRPRWLRWIEWAKQRLVIDGRIKRPTESGRGIWELKLNEGKSGTSVRASE